MGFYIQDDFWEAVSEQSPKVQNEVMGSLVRLFFTGEETKLTGVSKALFISFRERTNIARERAKSGAKGGAKRQANTQANSQAKRQANSQAKANQNSNSLLKSESKSKRESNTYPLVLNQNVNPNPLLPNSTSYEGVNVAEQYASDWIA